MIPDQMTIEQAAEYLREKLPGQRFFLGAYTDTTLPPAVTCVVMARSPVKFWRSDNHFSDAVRAAVGWARGQEAGNV